MFKILQNPYILLIASVSLVGAFGGYTAWIYQKGKENERAACNFQKQDTINESIDTRKKQDSVIRPDTINYIKRLWDGTA